ncbi:hypothetical protein RHSIM_Rhsim04G0006400 [Rhododendron simsii]|uniref:Uncharacterized protein n=1 Tax=Rhododendron simsii TaxID=118357 RepID=A0A834H3E3_RHOSS|nr:hypothetical protein RHSIM_Rhsim04G0006400 [Rhododendron simsii]
MRLGLARPSLSIFPPILSRANSVRPISCSSISPPPTSLKPQTPLFLRPPIYSATLSDLQKWQQWAKNLASSVGSHFTDLDNGPDPTLLHREINWLLQDALENPKLRSTHLGTDDGDTVMKMRAEMEDLYTLWKQRIEERRPFQYVVGCEHWRDMVLSVEEGVLVPRPETELIVDLVDDLVKGNGELREGLWADLGTGSGALAIGIARILGPWGRVIATDLSPVAVAVASYNVQRYNLQDKIEIKLGSWFEPLKNVEEQFVGLVSNPPYIPSDHIIGLQAEVAKHEPRLALDGGANGMDDLLHLCHGAASMLKPGGFFAFETNGEKQCKFLVDHMQKESKSSFSGVDIVSDFAGNKRFVTGFRAKST